MTRSAERRARFQALAEEQGAALLEFALVSSLFFLIIVGILYWGMAFLRYNNASFVAREGARWASVRGASSGSPATATDVQNYVNTRSSGMPMTATITWIPNNSAGNKVRVEVTSVVPLGIPFFSMTSVTVRSRAELVIIR